MIIDSDTLYEGEIYRAIAAKGRTEDAWLQFLQPRDARQKSQKKHDNILNYLLENEEDLKVRKTSIDYEEPETY